jgi:hypothetical protein
MNDKTALRVIGVQPEYELLKLRLTNEMTDAELERELPRLVRELRGHHHRLAEYALSRPDVRQRVECGRVVLFLAREGGVSAEGRLFAVVDVDGDDEPGSCSTCLSTRAVRSKRKEQS